MFFWGSFPFLRVGLAISIGIWLADYLNFHYWVSISLGTISILAIYLIKQYYPVSEARIQCLGLFLVLVLISLGSFRIQVEPSSESMEGLGSEDTVWLLGKIEKEIATSKSSRRYYFQTEALKINDEWGSADPNFLLYRDLEKDKLIPGTKILGKFSLKEIEKLPIPSDFDLREYYRKKGIVKRAFPKGEVKVLGNENTQNPLDLIKRSREFLIELFHERVKDQKALESLLGICLGVKPSSDSDTYETYRIAGAAHLLAVSGLHMGIVYLLVLKSGQFIGLGGRRRKYLSVLIILFLFLYSGISGFSASSLRAAFMLSIYEFGVSIHKETNPWNALGISAFGILMMDPNSLFDLGFQLSYLAMAGIFLFYSPLFRSLPFRNRIPKILCSVICISISVFLTTTPLVLLKFGIFQPLGLISNFFTGIASTLILGNFFLSLLVFPFSDSAFGLLIELLVFWNQALLWAFEKFKAIPFHSLDFINLDLIGLVLLLGSSLLLADHLWNRRVNSLAFLSLLLSGFFFWNIHLDLKIGSRKQIMLFSSSSKIDLAVVLGREAIFFQDSTIHSDFDEKSIAKALKCRVIRNHQVEKRKAVQVALFDHQVYFWDHKRKTEGGPNHYLLLKSYWKENDFDLLENYQGVILLPRFVKQKERLLVELKKKKLKFHDLGEGYFLKYI